MITLFFDTQNNFLPYKILVLFIKIGRFKDFKLT